MVKRNINQNFTKNSKVSDVINYSSFNDFGRLIFPVNKYIPPEMTLNNVGDIYSWYNFINPDKTVEIINYMKTHVDSGEEIFFNIYSEEEIRKDSSLKDAGLFFFKGNSNSKFAVVNAGGGFSYVGAMHDSFPHSLELSKKGYNAFALIYRPDPAMAMKDLARAIAFIHINHTELEVDVGNYSVWGGSAGARMTAWISTYGTREFGEIHYSKPSAVIMNYTGLGEVTGFEVPTYSCVGTSDYISDYRVMTARIDKLNSIGITSEIEIFEGLSHGFGLGEGTIAEGWIDRAIEFWNSQDK